MRTLLKIIGVSFELAIVFLILIYFGLRIWLYNRFDSVVEDLDYQEYVDDIKATVPLLENVFEAYEKIHHYDERTSTNQFLTSIPIKLLQKPNKHYICPCVEVNYKFVRNTFDRWTVGLHLDRDVGSRKCLEYHLNNQDFLMNQIGIRNASEFYFGKVLEELSGREMLKLCLMTKNPHLYNPLIYRERTDRWLNELISD